MESITSLVQGFSVALQPEYLLLALLGVSLGTLVGVLPGIGPTAAIAVLLPVSIGLDPAAAIIMLAGIYYGSMYGGSTTAILINTPGEAASVVTALDGFKAAQQGRAGPALAIAAIGSFVAGTLGVVGLMFLAPPLAAFALSLGPPEYFSFMLLGLTIVISLAGRSLLKGLASGAFGLLIAMIGLDTITGSPRFTFDFAILLDGIDFIPVVVGLFAISEVFNGIENRATSYVRATLHRVWPTKQDLKDSANPILRGSLLGFFLGIIPGASSSVTAFLSYDVEKKLSRHPEKFGTGAIEGVAAPESANNSAASGGMIPLLTLGIPPSAPLAVLLGGLLIHGLQPGPLLFTDHPDIVWPLIASMYVGNIMLLVLNLPLIPMWAKLANTPFAILGPMVLIFSVIGTYSVRNSLFDVWVALFFGVLGYLMRKLEISTIPLVLALVLGAMLEAALRQSLTISGGSLEIFFTRPISCVLLIAAAGSIVFSLYIRRKEAKRNAPSILGVDDD